MNIRGSICALVTPFQADGALDLPAFGRLLDYQMAGGTQAVVVAGSTGEAHMLEHDEYERLLAFALERVAGRIPVIAGTGEAGTAKTVALTRHAAELGADAALVVAPYYVRPTQEGMRRHFLEVAEHGHLPVLLYNVSARTSCDLLPETVAKLREHPAMPSVFVRWRNLCGQISSICLVTMAVLAKPCSLARPVRSQWWLIWCRRCSVHCVMRPLEGIGRLPRGAIRR